MSVTNKGAASSWTREQPPPRRREHTRSRLVRTPDRAVVSNRDRDPRVQAETRESASLSTGTGSPKRVYSLEYRCTAGSVRSAPSPPPAVGRSPVPHRGACRRGYWRGVGVAGATEATGRVCEETELRASVYRATVTRLAVARAAADDRRCGGPGPPGAISLISRPRSGNAKRSPARTSTSRGRSVNAGEVM